jgi:uncharacterized protein (TIGR03435 family)
MIRTAESQSSLKSTPAPEQSQTTADNPYVPTLTYDVASVREAHFAISEPVTMSVDANTSRSRIRLVNWDIESILLLAYDADGQRISGLPPWPGRTVFTIQAKGDDAADAKLASLSQEQQRMEQEHMMQVLLADRFKLKTHWEQRAGYSYALVVVKPGRLHESNGGAPTEAEIKRFGSHPVPSLYQRFDGQRYNWVGNGADMKELAALLSSEMHGPVVDETGLLGKYDFFLKYRGATDHDRAADDLDPIPPLDQAIQDQLGLKLERKRDSLPWLVIDHIEKPSEN